MFITWTPEFSRLHKRMGLRDWMQHDCLWHPRRSNSTLARLLRFTRQLGDLENVPCSTAMLFGQAGPATSSSGGKEKRATVI